MQHTPTLRPLHSTISTHVEHPRLSLLFIATHGYLFFGALRTLSLGKSALLSAGLGRVYCIPICSDRMLDSDQFLGRVARIATLRRRPAPHRPFDASPYLTGCALGRIARIATLRRRPVPHRPFAAVQSILQQEQ